MDFPDLSSIDVPLDIEGEPPLHRAARLGDHDEIRRLAAAGHPINALANSEFYPYCSPRYATPFMVAAGSSNGATVETLRLLLELGADPAFQLAGRSAATYAATGIADYHNPAGHVDRLQFVLQCGAPLPADPEERNSLTCAVASRGDAERLAILLKHGAPANGFWDLDRAVIRAVEHIKDSLWICYRRQPHPQDKPPTRKSHGLHLTNFQESCAEMSFKRITGGPDKSEIPLFCATSSRCTECVQLLLDAGANPFVRDNYAFTALFHATTLPIVRLLLQAGLSFRDRAEYGDTPMFAAVSDGVLGPAGLEAFLAAGADVNERDKYGGTAFLSAVRLAYFADVLPILLKAGADPHAVSDTGQNAFHEAINALDILCRLPDPSVFPFLKELGVDIEHRNESGYTPLGSALSSFDGNATRVLCELGADPNASADLWHFNKPPYERPNLPLLFHICNSERSDRDIKIKALLTAGADPLATDPSGFPPLAYLVANVFCEPTGSINRYKSFCLGLETLDLGNPALPHTRDEFLAQVLPRIQQFVDQFSAHLPMPGDRYPDNNWRTEHTTALALLSAHEAWARHHRRLRST
jgi:ankyrin repeat protein